MAIDVQIIDEHGTVLQEYSGPAFGTSLLKLAPPGGSCFCFITPWNDATFNQDQIATLLEEFHAAAAATSNPARQSELAALIRFVERAAGPHVYVKFVGD